MGAKATRKGSLAIPAGIDIVRHQLFHCWNLARMSLKTVPKSPKKGPRAGISEMAHCLGGVGLTKPAFIQHHVVLC